MIGRLAHPNAWRGRDTARTTPRPAADKLRAGDVIGARQLVSVADVALRVPDPDRLVHLQFRRFAGCPVCNLHLRSLVRHQAEITAAGVRQVIVFHSSAADLRPHVADLPFDVIADPSKQLYIAFGVESSARARCSTRGSGCRSCAASPAACRTCSFTAGRRHPSRPAAVGWACRPTS